MGTKNRGLLASVFSWLELAMIEFEHALRETLSHRPLG